MSGLYLNYIIPINSKDYNGLEGINKELKRRNRVSGAYSNDQSLLRVAFCIMMVINVKWLTGRKYLSMIEV